MHGEENETYYAPLALPPANSNIVTFACDGVRYAPRDVDCAENFRNAKHTRPKGPHVYFSFALLNNKMMSCTDD